MDDPAKSRSANGQFLPGRSGNPAGRPLGARNKASRLGDLLDEGDGAAIVRAVVDQALAGDRAALRACFSRLMPRPKQPPVEIDLPEIASAEDVVIAGSALIAAMAAGEITPLEAQAVMKLLGAQLRMYTALGRTAGRRTARRTAATASAQAEPCISPLFTDAAADPVPSPVEIPQPATACAAPAPPSSHQAMKSTKPGKSTAGLPASLLELPSCREKASRSPFSFAWPESRPGAPQPLPSGVEGWLRVEKGAPPAGSRRGHAPEAAPTTACISRVFAGATRPPRCAPRPLGLVSAALARSP